MATKSEKTGVVVSNKMTKSIVVAVEGQVRHGLYGKTERRTSKFMVHDEENTAKVGDTVEIVETRPLSRRKRWKLKRVVRKTLEVEAGGAGEAEGRPAYPAAPHPALGERPMIQMRSILDVADNS